MAPTLHPYLDLPTPHAIAHRGGASEAPENTIAAFRKALSAGYPFLETDTHATADGVLVAFHDDRLDRVTDREGTIAELPYAEVAKARVGDQPIPRLEELLEEFPGHRFNIDPKSDAAASHLSAVLRRTKALPECVWPRSPASGSSGCDATWAIRRARRPHRARSPNGAPVGWAGASMYSRCPRRIATSSW